MARTRRAAGLAVGAATPPADATLRVNFDSDIDDLASAPTELGQELLMVDREHPASCNRNVEHDVGRCACCEHGRLR